MKVGNLEVYGIIYKITNIINNKVYIGQSIYTFNLRYSNSGIGIERVYNYHNMLKNNNYNYNKHLLESIKKYGLNSFTVIENFDFAFSKEELNIKEIIWIKYYDSYKNGYNQNLGGDGNSGFKGLKGSDNPNSRKIVQLSLNGDFIKEWECISIAAETLNLNRIKILSACSRAIKSSGGFIYMTKEDYQKNGAKSYKKEIPKAKEILALDINYNIIKEYKSINEASIDTGINSKQISEQIRNPLKNPQNIIWIRKEEYNNIYNSKKIEN